MPHDAMPESLTALPAAAPDAAGGALVADLAAECGTLRARLEVVTADRDRLAALAAGLEARLGDELRAAAERQRADDAAFVDGIASAAVEAQAPIPADELALVRQRLEAGDRDGARAIGNAFLRAAQARGGPRIGRAEPLAPRAASHADLVERGVAMLAAADKVAKGK